MNPSDVTMLRQTLLRLCVLDPAAFVSSDVPPFFIYKRGDNPLTTGSPFNGTNDQTLLEQYCDEQEFDVKMQSGKWSRGSENYRMHEVNVSALRALKLGDVPKPVRGVGLSQSRTQALASAIHLLLEQVQT